LTKAEFGEVAVEGMESSLVNRDLLIGLGGVDSDNVSYGGAGSVQGDDVDGRSRARLVRLRGRQLDMPNCGNPSRPAAAKDGVLIAVYVC